MDFRPEPLPRRWTRALALAVLLTGVAIRPGGNAEANATFALARALALHQRYELGELASASSRTISRDGRRYADQPPGLAFFAWPLLAALRVATDDLELQAHALAVALGALAVAASSVLVARIAHARLGAPPRWALALGAVHAAGSVALAATGQLTGEPLAGALALGAFALAVPPPGDGGPRALRAGRALVIGGLLGWAVLTEPLVMPVALAVALVVAATTDGVFAWVPIALAFALPQLIASHYAEQCFGDPFALGARLETGVAGMPEVALARLVAGSPWLLLLPLVSLDAVFRLARGELALAEGACWLAAVLGLASVAGGFDRRAPWGGGPPAAIPFVPYLVLLLHPLRGRWMAVALPLFAVAGAVQLASLATDPLVDLPAAWSRACAGELATSRWAHDAASPGEARVGWILGEAVGLAGAWSLAPLALPWLLALGPPFAPAVREFFGGRRRRIGGSL